VEKMKAIGSRNLLKSYTKQREAQQEQLRSLIGKDMLIPVIHPKKGQFWRFFIKLLH